MPRTQLKISDGIKVREQTKSKPYFSMEVSPGIEESILTNKDPLFYSVTWLSQHNDLENVNLSSLHLAKKLSSIGHNVLLHLTSINMSIKKLDYIIQECKKIGVVNLLVLKGDKYGPSADAEFHYAADMVRYLRLKYKDEFCIGVAGYPDSAMVEEDMRYLKRKVDCGADFIMTQAFFEFVSFMKFSEACRLFDITVPIIPGIFIPNSCTNTFAKICHIMVPTWLADELTLLGNDLEAVGKYGKKLGTDLILEIVDKIPDVSVFHFFTLNNICPILLMCDDIGLNKLGSYEI